MTVLELEAKKASIIRAVLEFDDEKIGILDEVVQKLVSSRPCTLSQKEQRSQIEQGIKDQKAGLGRSHEDIVEKYKNRTA